MNSVQIRDVLHKDAYTSRFFKSVMSFDKLPDYENDLPALYVINTAPSSDKGKHWLCIFLEIDKPPEIFDSLALGIKNYNQSIENFLVRQGPKYVYNTKRLQGHNSDVCGDYSIMYAYFRCRGVSFNNFLSMFSTEFDVNDRRVELGM